ncbi:Titin [Wickerhamomyces ciferrii]|uniref:Titin n=1 Tax=Wickerhamomyces ciferrii (strain ATCC 14091 / BCRC 22168 / CBS 111 / JCM 3599 / NBRC 0793 / NRRL Y-1031 F-60-10) TaxID=1206466 RepID=K0KLD0_WICCF|nr:Titin [Wickerhamomyces ciferrii]CCH46065.1 Titin [Wickerhamomyces ciferrii]
MERSRRQRLSELYGPPGSQPSTPSTVRQRTLREKLESEYGSRSRDSIGSIKRESVKETKPIIKETHLKNAYIHNQQPQTLIPQPLLDIGYQKGCVIALFIIIQSYKIYDLTLLKSNLPIASFLGFPSQRFNFITKYILYDSAFLYFLPAFRIPSFTFKKITVFSQILAILAINLFLVSDLSFPITTLLFQAWKTLNHKDLTILGGTSRSQNNYDPHKHFKGSHTIKILPENTAFLNPFGDSFCLPQGVKNHKVHVPIRFNSTSEIDFIQVKYVDLETNVPILLNYTKKDLRKFEKNVNDHYERDSISGPNIHYLNLPILKTGLYEIGQVLDSKYLGLRNYRSSLIVPTCPTARIDNLDELENDKCHGDLDTVKFTITGVPPLKLKYKKLVNHEVYEFNDQSLQPEFFKSPLLSHGSYKSLNKKQLSNLEWAKSIPVQVELENPVKDLGDYSYKIEEVIDGLGNLVNFTETLKNNDNLFQSYGLSHSFYAHDSPKLHLSEKLNRNSPTKKSIFLHIDSSAKDAAPYEATIKFISDDEQKTEEIFTHIFTNENDELPVENPGIYTLESVNTKHCPAVVTGRSSVLISLPVVPKLQVNSKPITDSCVGQVGLVFDLSFVGTPPFTLQQSVHRIENGQRKFLETKKLISQGTRYRFSYEPSTEGNYEISFDNLLDSLYLEPIHLSPSSDYTYKTSMRVKPSAEIHNYHKSGALCLGSQGKVAIQLKGEAPFQLDYDIIETLTNKRIPYSIKDIKSNRYEIKTPAFNVGGEYIVSLTSVEDNSGCLVNLNGADANIAVRREIPSIGFGQLDSSTKIKIKEGEKVELPIRLLGEGSFDVTYDYHNSNGEYISTHHKSFRNAHKSSIDVTKAGIYKLKSVKDSLCSGNVDKTDTYEVTYHPKPSLAVNEQSKQTKVNNNVFTKARVCQFYEDSIDLSLYGAPPFVVDYTAIDPNGYRSSKSISVATRFASIRLPNDKGGEFKYIINGIYDAIYSKSDLAKIRYNIDPITVSQSVISSPSGEFKDKRKSYRTCTTNLLDHSLLEPIKLNLNGNAPYTITFEIYHESSSKSDFLTLKDIKTPMDLKDLYRGLKLGNHIVNIVKIIDADGCIQEDFAESNYISISITDTPKISQLDSSVNYCVGDHIGYQLIGTPPFTVVYSFNGLDLKSVERSSQFSRLASEPGTIGISSLQDSSSNCVVNFTLPENKDLSDKLTINVRPIPSVEVSEGDIIVQDIHEGDQAEVIFSFEGTPPFALTYVRYEEVEVKRGRRRSQVVETHTVNGIYAFEYRVLTSLQGTYEAIEVSDAFCVARNEERK